MKLKWVFAFMVSMMLMENSMAQTATMGMPADPGKLIRGKFLETHMVVSSPKPVTVQKITVFDLDGGFEVFVNGKKGPEIQYPFDVTSGAIGISLYRPLWTGFGGPSAGDFKPYFSVEYSIDGNPQPPIGVNYHFTYSTASWIFFLCGMIGLVFGYVVKSINAKRTEDSAGNTSSPNNDSANPPAPDNKPPPESYFHFMFIKGLPNLVVLLILGAAALMYFYYQSANFYGFEESLLLGVVIGLTGDETLIQKLQGGVIKT